MRVLKLVSCCHVPAITRPNVPILTVSTLYIIHRVGSKFVTSCTSECVVQLHFFDIF